MIIVVEPTVASRNRLLRIHATNAASASPIGAKPTPCTSPGSKAPTGPAELATVNFRELLSYEVGRIIRWGYNESYLLAT
jgi:hypothetical protein